MKRSILILIGGYLLAQIVLSLMPSGEARADQMTCKEIAGGWLGSKKLATNADNEDIWASGMFYGFVAGFMDRTIELQAPMTEAERREYNMYDHGQSFGYWLDENPQYWRVSITAHDCVYKWLMSL